MKEFNFLDFYKLLPQPDTLTEDDCALFWNEFKSYFIELLEKKQFQSLIDLFAMTRTPLKFFSKKIDTELQKEILLRLYNIITEIPIISYGLVIEAADFMAHFLSCKPVKELQVDWKPLYKIYRYITLKSPSSYVVDSDELSQNLFKIMGALNNCYPKGSLDEIFNKFLPKISPHAVDSTVYLTMISKLLPDNDKSFHKWLPNLRDLLIDYGTLIQLVPLVSIFNSIISNNIEYDFSDFLIPIVVQICGMLLTEAGPQHLTYEFSTVQLSLSNHTETIPRLLAEAIVNLMASLPTREKAIEKMASIMTSTQIITKDTSSMDDKFTAFVYQVLNSLHRTQNKIEKGDYPESMKLTTKQLQAILTPIVDTLICLLKSLDATRAVATIMSIRLIMDMDKSYTPRFFEFADLCISHSDAQAIGYIGWNIMSAVMADITKYDFLMENMGRIFEIAISNFFRTDTQRPLTHTLYVITSLIPFNHEYCNPAVKYVDFTSITERFITSYLDIISRLPALPGKQAPIDVNFCDLIRSIFDNIFSDGEPDIFRVLRPIILASLQDTVYCHVMKLITSLVVKFYESAPAHIYEEAMESLKNGLRTHHEVDALCYELHLFGLLSCIDSKCIDDVKKIAAIIKPFTNHPHKKVRKTAYKALSFAITPWACTPITSKIDDKKGGFKPINEFKVEAKPKFDISEVALDVFGPLFDILLNEKDVTKVITAIRPALYALQGICDFIFDVTEGDLTKLQIAQRISYFNNPVYTKSSTIKDKFLQIFIRLIKDFQDNPLLMRKLIPRASTFFVPMISINYEMTDTMDQLSSQFWPVEREKNLAVKSIVAPIIKNIQYRRITSHIVPASKLIKEFMSAFIPLATSRYKPIRNTAKTTFEFIGDFYNPVLSEYVFNIVDHANNIPTDEFIDFITIPIIFNIINAEPKVLCKVIYRVLSKFDIKDQESILNFKQFMTTNCIRAPSYDNFDNTALQDLLSKIQSLLINAHSQHKVYHHIILLVLTMALTHGITLNQFFINYVIDSCSAPDNEICSSAYLCIVIIFKSIPVSKVKNIINSKPKLHELSNVLDSCKLNFATDHQLRDIIEIPSQEQPDEGTMFMDIPTPAEIRMILKQQGVPDEQLDIAVEQVMEQMRELILSQQLEQQQEIQKQVDMQMQQQGIDPDNMTDEEVLAILNGEAQLPNTQNPMPQQQKDSNLVPTSDSQNIIMNQQFTNDPNNMMVDIRMTQYNDPNILMDPQPTEYTHPNVLMDPQPTNYDDSNIFVDSNMMMGNQFDNDPNMMIGNHFGNPPFNTKQDMLLNPQFGGPSDLHFSPSIGEMTDDDELKIDHEGEASFYDGHYNSSTFVDAHLTQATLFEEQFGKPNSSSSDFMNNAEFNEPKFRSASFSETTFRVSSLKQTTFKISSLSENKFKVQSFNDAHLLNVKKEEINYNKNYAYNGFDDEDEDYVGYGTGANETLFQEIYDAINHMVLDWEEPTTPHFFYSQSAGWNFYPKHDIRKKFMNNIPNVSAEAIVKIISTFCSADSDRHVVIQSFPIVASVLAMTFTEETVDMIAEAVKKIMCENLSVYAIPTFAYLIEGVTISGPKMDFNVYKRFIQKVALPIICAISLNVQFSQAASGIMMVMFSEEIIDYCAPIIQMLFEYSNISPEDATVITRSFFNHLNTIFCARPTSFFCAFDMIVEKFIRPFFAGMANFNRTINAEFVCMFVMLIESTCIRPTSALYSPILDQKRQVLLDEFDDAFSKINTSNKAAQGVIVSLLSYVAASSVMAVQFLAPIILKHQRIILMASNETDEETEDAIFTTILNFTMHQHFLYQPDLLADYIDLIISYIMKLSIPMQLKMIFHVLTIITMDAFAFSSAQFDHFYDIVLKFIRDCKNENLKGEALAVLGRIILITKKNIKLNELTAAAVLNAASIFDECDQIILDAFEVVKEKLEGRSENKALLKDVVQLFWKQHSFSVTPKVEAALDPYRTLVPPSYIT